MKTKSTSKGIKIYDTLKLFNYFKFKNVYVGIIKYCKKDKKYCFILDNIFITITTIDEELIYTLNKIITNIKYGDKIISDKNERERI